MEETRMTWNINNWIDERTFDYARSFTFEPIAHNRSRYNSEWSSLTVSATAHSNGSSSGSEARYIDIGKYRGAATRGHASWLLSDQCTLRSPVIASEKG